jgi:hypothetical protein
LPIVTKLQSSLNESSFVLIKPYSKESQLEIFIQDNNLSVSCLLGFNTPSLTESQPETLIHDNNLRVSALFGFKIPNLTESQPVILIQDNNLSVSCEFGFKIPNLTESQPVIDKQETSLTESEVVFNNPCFIESQLESLITTGGVAVGVDSIFEQEYMIENIKTKKK